MLLNKNDSSKKHTKASNINPDSRMIRCNSYKESKFKIKAPVIDRHGFRSNMLSNNSLNSRSYKELKISSAYDPSKVFSRIKHNNDVKLKESDYYSTTSKHSKKGSF